MAVYHHWVRDYFTCGLTA